MKKIELFKLLIDILFYGLCIGMLSLFFIAPLGFNMIAMEEEDVLKWDIFSWTIVLLSMIAYLLLVVGVMHLRTSAKYMISKGQFFDKIPDTLKKSGKALVLSSLLNYIMFIVIFLKKLYVNNELSLLLDNNVLLQMILTIVGLFLIIQSDLLRIASDLKQENDLTI